MRWKLFSKCLYTKDRTKLEIESFWKEEGHSSSFLLLETRKVNFEGINGLDKVAETWLLQKQLWLQTKM